MKTILSYLFHMGLYALASVPFALLWRQCCNRINKKRGIQTTQVHEIVATLMFMYMVALFSQTIIPKFEIVQGTVHFFQTGYNKINLVPFKEMKIAIRTGGSFFAVNIIGNVAVFVPIPIFIKMLYDKKVSYMGSVAITAAVSIFVELCQLPQDRGTDIDDVMLNTGGAILGALTIFSVRKIKKKRGNNSPAF